MLYIYTASFLYGKTCSACNADRGHKRAPDPLELELQGIAKGWVVEEVVRQQPGAVCECEANLGYRASSTIARATLRTPVLKSPPLLVF